MPTSTAVVELQASGGGTAVMVVLLGRESGDAAPMTNQVQLLPSNFFPDFLEPFRVSIVLGWGIWVRFRDWGWFGIGL